MQKHLMILAQEAMVAWKFSSDSGIMSYSRL